MKEPDQSKGLTIKLEGLDLKPLAKPVEKLIEAVSKGVGKFYKPTGIVREAKARAEASIILAHAKAEQQEIAIRATERLSFLELRRQKNIELITDAATKALPESVDDKPVDEDWMIQFFQQAQDIGDTEMQKIWAKILASEVSKPGTFSKRTLERVRTLDRDEAELFSKLCRTLWKLGDKYRVRINHESVNTFDEQLEINVFYLNHLKSIGLLSSDDIFYSLEKMGGFSVGYFSEVFKLSLQQEGTRPEGANPQREARKFPRPFIVTPLTDVGNELATIVKCDPFPGFGKAVMEAVAIKYKMMLTVTPAD